MPNSLIKDLEIMWDAAIDGYDSACVISRECETSFPSPQDMQRAGDVFYRPQNYNANIVEGLDISASAKTDVIQRMVPTVYRQPANVTYSFDAKEMRDASLMAKMGEAAATRLSGEVDRVVYNDVTARAGIVVKKVGALGSRDVSMAEALMVSRGMAGGRELKAFFNAMDYIDLTQDLANRAYIGDRTKGAYERSQVPDVANFKTFRTDNQSVVAAVGTVTGTTVSGAGQSLTVAAMSGDLPKDNRQMTLVVAGANIANIKAGDALTIAGVNAVHNIDKGDTGALFTTRVLSNTAGTLVISPAIIATGPYQNVTAAPANGAAVTFVNTASKASNVFWTQGSVALNYGKLAFPTDQGAKVSTRTTKNGVPIIMSYGFNHMTGKTDCRFTTLFAVSVLEPEQCGIILANQT